MERETYKKLCKDCRKEILGERATELFDKLWQDTDEFTVVMHEDNENQHRHAADGQDVVIVLLLDHDVSDATRHEINVVARQLYEEFGTSTLHHSKSRQDLYLNYLRGAGGG